MLLSSFFIIICLYLSIKLYFYKRDLALLNLQITEINNFSWPKFKNKDVKKVFSTFLLIRPNMSRFEMDSEVMSLGVNIARKVLEPNAVAQELAKIVHEKIGVELIGVVILSHDSGRVKITQSAGLAVERIAGVLEICATKAIEANLWGYQDLNLWSDFSIFGIKRSLAIPLKFENQLEGLIWLGLAGSTLCANKAEMIKKLAEYAAVSFQTAKKFGKEKEFQQKEKDFLLGLSHDLRSPGNRALFCVRDLLNDSQLSDLAKEQLEIAEISINEQMSMISDVLDLAKLQGGVLHSAPVETNLLKELTLLKDRFRLDLERKKLVAEFNCSEELTVFIDPLHLRRIFNNLMCNAIKFTSSGGIYIEIDEARGMVEIVFRDTGVGIRRDRSIFERFSPSSSGHGLGLYLVKALAEVNHGEILSYPSSFSGANLGIKIPKEASF